MSAFSGSSESSLSDANFVERYSLSKLQGMGSVFKAELPDEEIRKRVQQAWELIPWEAIKIHITQKELNDTLYTIEKNREELESVSLYGGGFVQRKRRLDLHRSLYISKEAEIFILFKEHSERPGSEKIQGSFKTITKVVALNRLDQLVLATSKIIDRGNLMTCRLVKKEVYERSCRNEESFGASLRGAPHVVQFHETIYYINKGVKKQGIIMPFYNSGMLEDYFDKKVTKLFMFRMTMGMIRGLGAIHEKGIIHRDIKPENIMVHKETMQEGVVESSYVIDLGISIHQDDKSHYLDFPGPLGYRPLEVFHYLNPIDHRKTREEYLKHITVKVDIYSLGIVLGEFWLKMKPQYNRKTGEINEHYRRWKEPHKEANQMEHLIWSMTRDNPAERPSCSEAEKRLEEILLSEEIVL